MTLRILMVTPAFLPQVGGLESVVYHLSQALRGRGHQVAVAHLSIFEKTPRRELMQGLEVFRLPLRGTRLLGWAPDLRKLASRFDLLHVHDPQLMAITANVRLQGGAIPSVLSTHGGFNHTGRLKLGKKLYEKLLLKAVLSRYQRILTSSDADHAYFSPFCKDAVLCPNGADLSGFMQSEHSEPQPWRWIYWGRLAVHKRLDLVIDYLFRLRQMGRPVHLTICGWDFDGTELALRQRIDQLGLSPHVTLKGEVTTEALLEEVRKHGVFISASEHEGFGLSFVEAMAAGRMIVCRNRAPMSTMMAANSAAIALEFNQTESDILKLDQFLSQPFDILSEQIKSARQFGLQYGWEHAVDRFIHAYESCLP
ncbi:MAG TPA: glycosyltransferase family 4 protein [Aquabacterium sp.]|nr:glycosyltransferase family 4 protein [Aquabacterium sp.]